MVNQTKYRQDILVIAIGLALTHVPLSDLKMGN